MTRTARGQHPRPPHDGHHICHTTYLGPALSRIAPGVLVEALSQPPRHYATSETMCPLCSEVRRDSTASRARHDPVTGRCTSAKACAKRRASLDDETIEFLGLIPRGQEQQ